VMPSRSSRTLPVAGEGPSDISSGPCCSCAGSVSRASRESLVQALDWLAEAVPLENAEAPPPLSVASAVPSCRGHGCDVPLRRHPDLEVFAIERIEESTTQGLMADPDISSRMVAMVLGSLFERTHLPSSTRITFGPASFHAAIIANNLLYPASMERLAPGQDGADWQRGTDHSLGELRSSLSSVDEIADDRITAGDLVFIDLLVEKTRTVLRGIGELDRKRALRWRDFHKIAGPRPLIFGGASLFLLLFAGLVGLPRLFLPLGLALLACAVMGFLRRWRTSWLDRIWIKRLRSAAARPDYSQLAEEFWTFDFLRRSEQIFAGTPAAEPEAASKLIRSLYGIPGGSAILPLIARGVARGILEGGQDARASALGECLLARDFRSRGAHFVSHILIDLVHLAEAKKDVAGSGASRLWSLLAAGPPFHEAGASPSPSRLVARFFLRTASNLATRRAWSHMEAEVHARAQVLSDRLFALPKIGDRAWHLFLLRFLGHALRESQGRGLAFVPPSRHSMSDLLDRIVEIHSEFLRFGGGDGDLSKECDEVLRLSGFSAFLPPEGEDENPAGIGGPVGPDPSRSETAGGPATTEPGKDLTGPPPPAPPETAPPSREAVAPIPSPAGDGEMPLDLDALLEDVPDVAPGAPPASIDPEDLDLIEEPVSPPAPNKRKRGEKRREKLNRKRRR
jgi:hypothetical protein